MELIAEVVHLLGQDHQLVVFHLLLIEPVHVAFICCELLVKCSLRINCRHLIRIVQAELAQLLVRSIFQFNFRQIFLDSALDGAVAVGFQVDGD